ncbi:hypothetical protein CWI39_2748p0010 [Hamiltosporidium magnivora]|uniref:Uncharacterized protein n=1 Tax=Hamiltosporidium magnivora TaxID=148818 RepID=A0A4Q9KSR6_9MICR|nr:hypothetical protein CWI39_2748p0010 [Hamiltosporidium magnivora]
MNKSKQDIDDTVNIHRSIFKIIKNVKIKEEEEENLETKEEWQKVNLSFLESPALKLNETSICHHEYKRFPMLKYHMEYKFPIMVYKKNEYSFQSKLLNKASQDNKQEILFNNLENKETKAKNNIKYDLLNKSEKTKLAPFCNKKPLKYKSSHKDSIFGKISNNECNNFSSDSKKGDENNEKFYGSFDNRIIVRLIIFSITNENKKMLLYYRKSFGWLVIIQKIIKSSPIVSINFLLQLFF